MRCVSIIYSRKESQTILPEVMNSSNKCFQAGSNHEVGRDV